MSKNKRGYTLIESIVVIAIVFILGGITIGLSFE
ncbi:prepilin-type N-terminal cleavage/methylation domain-containing protein [Clostridium saudiense]|nr:prepilin-type N-terminal cleavage/methylation domain-containing protein [Clostridium saudiense]